MLPRLNSYPLGEVVRLSKGFSENYFSLVAAFEIGVVKEVLMFESTFEKTSRTPPLHSANRPNGLSTRSRTMLVAVAPPCRKATAPTIANTVCASTVSMPLALSRRTCFGFQRMTSCKPYLCARSASLLLSTTSATAALDTFSIPSSAGSLGGVRPNKSGWIANFEDGESSRASDVCNSRMRFPVRLVSSSPH